jgi:hypothetical protein
MMYITWYAVVQDDSTRQPVGLYADVEGDRFHSYIIWYRGTRVWRDDPDCLKYTGIGGTQSTEAILVSRSEAQQVADALGTDLDGMWMYLQGIQQSVEWQAAAARARETMVTMRTMAATVPIPPGVESLGTPIYTGTIAGIREDRTTPPEEERELNSDQS